MNSKNPNEVNVLIFCSKQDTTLDLQLLMKESLKNVSISHTSEFIFLEKMLEKKHFDILLWDIDDYCDDIPLFVSKLKTFKGELLIQSKSASFATVAFDLGATDYLFKPYSIDRFKEALNKVVHNLEKIKKIPRDKKKLKKASKKTTSIIVKERYKSIVVRTDDIVYLFSKKGLIHIVTSSKTYYHYDSLNNFEKILDRNYFIRTNRNCICNLKFVSSIKDMGKNKYSVSLNKNTTQNFDITIKRGIKYRLIDKLNKNKLRFDYVDMSHHLNQMPLLLNRA